MVRHGWFFRLRVSVLLTVFAIVSLWACYDVRDRRARNEWLAPVRVGLVIVRRGAVDPDAVAALHLRTSVLDAQLYEELRRYRPAQHRGLIHIVPYGPVESTETPPSAPGPDLLDRLVHAYELWRYTRAIDRRAGVPADELDSRIYVVAEPPRAGSDNFVEGFSQTRGRVGVARVDLERGTVDLALFVAAHELLHTLGASDKYDALGRTQFPEGLPEPARVPLYPQRYAEVMARNRVLAPDVEVPPDDLRELRVGLSTAREIGWTK
jgi:hypothetical protein